MFIPLTPIRFLHRAVDLYGPKVGIISGDKRFTYAQFGERSERLATALGGLGVQPGDRVAYLSLNTHQLLEGYYGVIQARAAVTPLNVRLTAPELTAILNHSGARLLLFENEFAPVVEKLRAACPAIEKFITLDDAVPLADLTYEELLAQGRPERADVMSYDENSTAELFYTSGSTGTPKGVMLSHRTVYLHALYAQAGMPIDDTFVCLHTIPLFHANGWGSPQTATLMGCGQVMVRRFDPVAVLELIQEHRATSMFLVPTMTNALLNVPDAGEFDLSSMKYIHIGGAASSPELVERTQKLFTNAICCAGYGLTETSPVVSTGRPKGAPPPQPDWRRRAMAGWPFPCTEVRVVGSQMNDVPRDMKAIGEVVVRGDIVMEGYYQDAEGTAAVMSGEWFHTGDMAVWDEETVIHIVDRKKEIIISGGENISSLEIERAIAAHPEVYECAVVSAPDERWGEVPAAFVMLKPGSKLSAEELLAFLSDRLARFKLPRRIEFSEEPLPKTGTGKMRKLELRERFWAGKERRVQG
ncbi:MAG: long-chain-fatty-acid--CoA ligase [Acidobacteriota bacterium]